MCRLADFMEIKLASIYDDESNLKAHNFYLKDDLHEHNLIIKNFEYEIV